MFVLTLHGGHLGFFEGAVLFPKPLTWMDKLILEYANAICHWEKNKPQCTASSDQNCSDHSEQPLYKPYLPKSSIIRSLYYHYIPGLGLVILKHLPAVNVVHPAKLFSYHNCLRVIARPFMSFFREGNFECTRHGNSPCLTITWFSSHRDMEQELPLSQEICCQYEQMSQHLEVPEKFSGVCLLKTCAF